MLAEALASVLVALAILWLLFAPLLGAASPEPAWEEPEDPDETPRGVALIALKDLELDRATGKLSDEDYVMLKGRYAAEAITALREEEARPAARRGGVVDVEALVVGRRRAVANAEGGAQGKALSCPRCGPRPEPDARCCSGCGATLVIEGDCGMCGAVVEAAQRFCGSCGRTLATRGEESEPVAAHA